MMDHASTIILAIEVFEVLAKSVFDGTMASYMEYIPVRMAAVSNACASLMIYHYR